jgi:hypothetical protein
MDLPKWSRPAARIAIVLAGASAACGLWLGEVCWVKGWRGLAWLAGFQWSSLPICIVIVSLCLLVGGPASWRNRMKFLTAGSAVALMSFLLERYVAFEVFSGWPPLGLDARLVLGFLFGAATVPVTFPLLCKWWLSTVSWLASVFLAIALVLVLPLSFVTVLVLPAFNGSTDPIHAIKMGYPVFWTALLVPVALRLGRTLKPRHEDRVLV